MSWQIPATIFAILIILLSKRYSDMDIKLRYPRKLILWVLALSALLALQNAIGWKANNIFGSVNPTLFDFFDRDLTRSLLLAPLAEELIFRGLIFRILLERTSIMFAAIITSTLFLFGHISLSNPMILLYVAFLTSMLLCAVYVKYGLLTCVIFHSSINFSVNFFAAAIFKLNAFSVVSLKSMEVIYLIAVLTALILILHGYQGLRAYVPDRLKVFSKTRFGT